MKVNFEEAVYFMILLNYCLYGTFCILLNIWHRINESMNEILGCLLFSKKKKKNKRKTVFSSEKLSLKIKT